MKPDREKQFNLERVQGAPVTTGELIADLKRVSAAVCTDIVSQRTYNEAGRYDPKTIALRFGTWNKALAPAGLKPANVINYPDTDLFENIMRLWEHYGRQPHSGRSQGAELKAAQEAEKLAAE